MPSFLEEVIAHKQGELLEKATRCSLAELKSKVEKGSFQFKKALEGDGLKLIAELKPRSPSLGDFSADAAADLKARLEIYKTYANAVSVLCDQRFFGGSIDLLAQVSQSLSLPTLLKDFVISEYQIYEGRVAGAQAALLIVKILTEKQLEEYSRLCRELGMTAVVEVQNEAELKKVEAIAPEILLINNRNLDSLEIDLRTVENLSSKINYPSLLIAASGIETGAQLAATRPFASRFLIGSALMKEKNPAAKFEEFLQADKDYLAKRETNSACP